MLIKFNQSDFLNLSNTKTSLKVPLSWFDQLLSWFKHTLSLQSQSKYYSFLQTPNMCLKYFKYLKIHFKAHQWPYVFLPKQATYQVTAFIVVECLDIYTPWDHHIHTTSDYTRIGSCSICLPSPSYYGDSIADSLKIAARKVLTGLSRFVSNF